MKLAGGMARWWQGAVLRRLIAILGAGFLLAAGLANAQSTAAWTVQPQWVRAHEAFLASDAMRGRGSATHDEEVTATYVASEFEGYGLKPAPGMTGFLQTAAITGPLLDGHATVTAGNVHLAEGEDVTLVMSSGTSVSGPLAVVPWSGVGAARVSRGAVVVISGREAVGAPGSFRALFRSGAAAVLMEETPMTERMFEANGGKTHTPVTVAGSPARQQLPTLVTLSPENLDKVEHLGAGTVVSVNVHPVPQTQPRNTYNAVGYLPGTDPAAGTILLTAHLDHEGVGRPENGDGIWNGANDDAAGTTAVLELAHALGTGAPLRRGVLFVCYGSEELGELGSTYFGEHPPVPLKELVANLEFEMIGNQDPKMPNGVLLLTGWDRSNLGPELKAHGALLGPDPYPEEHFFERSDNYALALKGVVAHTAAGWGTPPTYHRPDDDLAHLDVPFMTAAIQSLVEPVRWLASSDFVPKWNPGGRPKEH